MTFRRQAMKSVALTALFLLFTLPAQAGDIAARQQAAAHVARQDATCTAIGDFYWEIGDKDGKLAGGSIGKKYGPNTNIDIYSAAKLVFGAYVLEKLGGKAPDEHQVQLLNMTGGYAHAEKDLLACSSFSHDIAACAAENLADKPDPADVGIFSYSSHGDEALAVELGLGDKTKKTMAAEYKTYLGKDINFTFNSLQLASGLNSTPGNYARFLRKILSGDLRMKEYLGTHAVCAMKSACPDKVGVSPMPYDWHYSLNHWVEDDKHSDGAFSSSGLAGFYPWISADKTTYGLIARQVFAAHSWAESAKCGIAIRKAWMTGKSAD